MEEQTKDNKKNINFSESIGIGDASTFTPNYVKRLTESTKPILITLFFNEIENLPLELFNSDNLFVDLCYRGELTEDQVKCISKYNFRRVEIDSQNISKFSKGSLENTEVILYMGNSIFEYTPEMLEEHNVKTVNITNSEKIEYSIEEYKDYYNQVKQFLQSINPELTDEKNLEEVMKSITALSFSDMQIEPKDDQRFKIADVIIESKSKKNRIRLDLNYSNFDNIFNGLNLNDDLDVKVQMKKNVGLSLNEFLTLAKFDLQSPVDGGYNVKATPSELHKVPIDIIKKFKPNIFLHINNISRIVPEELEEYNVKKVGVNYKNNTDYKGGIRVLQNIYSKDEMLAIYDELNRLLDGIDDNLLEEKKVGEIFKRISTSIIYDYPAAYPTNEEEEEYSKQNSSSCRNLKNGLLQKKCVCAGYAEIFRNACLMKGIEAQYVAGEIGTIIDESQKNTDRFKHTIIDENAEGLPPGKIRVIEYHAWTKVKVNGQWYNFDPCWAHDAFVQGGVPRYAFCNDETMKNAHNTKLDIAGPECNIDLSYEQVAENLNIKIAPLVNENNQNINSVVDENNPKKKMVNLFKRVGALITNPKTIVNRIKDSFNKKKNTPALPPPNMQKVEATTESKEELPPSLRPLSKEEMEAYNARVKARMQESKNNRKMNEPQKDQSDFIK